MQFHHHGYVSGEPRVQPARGVGLDRPADLPEAMDVLVVGAGPAGMMAAATLSAYPDVHTRLVDRRPGRLEIGQADGIQARSVETFQAFGFAGRITEEAYRITEMNFWTPDPERPGHIVRSARALDDEHGMSEFPHLIVNQARVLDHLAQFAADSPSRLLPDWGYDFAGLEKTDDPEYPVTVRLVRTAGEQAGAEVTVRTKYVIGADGARSKVRAAIGRSLVGDAALHAWGVMDVLAVTDFPDIRTKCAIQSDAGSILHIPREGGHLFRMYVDLGVTPPDDAGRVRQTPLETIIAKAGAIIAPYTLEVKDVAWWSVYEVGHRLTDKFDDVPAGSTDTPHVFIAGDACHTHSAKAGQGMNVSMQDTFNLAWKLGQVVSGLSPESILHTYSKERQVIAQNLIDFDKEWSSLMAKPAAEWDDPAELGRFYTRTAEFPSGFMTQYPESPVIGSTAHQGLATGYPVGKRFKSALVTRVSDTNPIHIGHEHRVDGRWRIYVFADAPAPGQPSAVTDWAEWMNGPDSPVSRYTPAGADRNALFDIKVVYQQAHTEFATIDAPEIFHVPTGPFQLTDYDSVFAAGGEHDIFAERGIDRDGAVVVVRPDQYVAAVLPLTATAELAAFFAQNLLPQH